MKDACIARGAAGAVATLGEVKYRQYLPSTYVDAVTRERSFRLGRSL